MTDKDNTVDIFSRKKLSSIEAEKESAKKHEQEEFKKAAQILLNQYQEMLDNGTLRGISLLGVREGAIITPRSMFIDMASLHALQFAAKENEICLHEYLADCYGLREVGYEEE